MSLLESTLFDISKEVRNRSGINSKVIHGITKTGNPGLQSDSIINTLMIQYNATHAIAITFFNIYFDQTEVQVTKDEDGKSREAFYDIVSEINYVFYDKNGVFKERKMVQRRFYSSRFVLSGLLAAGPNVVSKRDDAFGMARNNLVKYLNNFFPGWEERSRTLFVGKELSTVRTALAVGDYEAAMEESRRFTNHPDHKLAAKANYNCAVLFERENRPFSVKLHLEQSLRMYSLPEAGSMMNDYGSY